MGGELQPETIRETIRNHGESMTGRKEELLEKLVNVAVRLYKEKESLLYGYFAKHKFIRLATIFKRDNNTFPILEDFDLIN